MSGPSMANSAWTWRKNWINWKQTHDNARSMGAGRRFNSWSESRGRPRCGRWRERIPNRKPDELSQSSVWGKPAPYGRPEPRHCLARRIAAAGCDRCRPFAALACSGNGRRSSIPSCRSKHRRACSERGGRSVLAGEKPAMSPHPSTGRFPSSPGRPTTTRRQPFGESNARRSYQLERQISIERLKNSDAYILGIPAGKILSIARLWCDSSTFNGQTLCRGIIRIKPRNASPIDISVSNFGGWVA